MKPFAQLTYHGQARRVRRLALNALSQYNLEIKDVRFICMWTIGIFRLRTRCGGSYVLRVCAPGWRTETDLRSEIIWLQALKQDTDIRVPEPVPTRNGEYMVQASAEGVPEPRFCMAMSWLPGSVLLGSRLTEANLYQMGKLFARLHEHTARFKPPHGFTQRQMNQIYARGERDILFGDSCRDAFTPRTRDIFARTKVKVDEAFARLYGDSTGLRVIHNDLWHENIKVYRGQLYPFDFEDTIWGYPVQDMAMALLDLMTDD